MPKVAFLTPYPFGFAPGPRFRFEQYLDVLEENGISYRFFPFLNKYAYFNLYKSFGVGQKVLHTLKGYLLRIWQLIFVLWQYDFIFVYREATPFGFPFVEWWVTKVWRKKLIYDFDDAIWIPATSAQNRWVSALKAAYKVPLICRWAHRVSVGNAYLAEHARLFRAEGESSQAVVLNPTTLETESWHNRLKNHEDTPLTIGWTGTHSTLPYLDELLPVLERLEQEFSFRFRVICNQKPDFSLRSLEFIPWNKDTEIEDLLALHIGIMPLTDDHWAKGKCGFKALQYMALGIPPIASPVGVNATIIQTGENGFLAQTPEEWEAALRQLLENKRLRQSLGERGRQTVVAGYSVQSNRENFLRLFS
ncbi:MAG: glycosyltransferase [Bacteroidota bacterium]